MDDWLVFTNCRSVLRQLVKTMHEVMHRMKVKLAKTKTFIGKVTRGLTSLGYRFEKRRYVTLIHVSHGFMSNAIQKAGGYVRRWFRWVLIKRLTD